MISGKSILQKYQTTSCVSTMLPNLSSLSLSRREEEENVGLPLSKNLPYLVMRDDGRSATPFFPKLAFGLFQTGAVFSAIDGTVSYSTHSPLQEAIFRNISELSEEVLEFNSFSSGTFNRVEKISKENLAAEPNSLKSLILRVSSNISGKELNAVVLRTSKAETVEEYLSADYIHDGSYTALLDEMFQELFISLFAAERGIGPDIYFAKVMMVKYRNSGKEQHLPRVVYVMEAADSDLKTACASIGYRMSSTMSLRLYELMRRAADNKLLLLDIKTANIVVFKDEENPSNMEFTKVKLIDFGTDYATIIPGGYSPVEDEIMYINTCMLCFYVGTFHRHAAWIRGGQQNLECFLPVMKDLFYWVKMKQARYDSGLDSPSDNSTLINNLQTKKVADINFKSSIQPPRYRCQSEAYTLLDMNTDMTSIEKMVYAAVYMYALNNTDLYDLLPLFQYNSFDPDQPLFPQLVRNFVRFYEDFLGKQSHAGPSSSSSVQVPPNPSIPNPGPQQAPPSDPKPLFNENRKRELSNPKSRRELRQ